MSSNPAEFPEQSLPHNLQGLLAGVALHRGFVDADYLAVMASAVDESWTVEDVDQFMEELESRGLAWDFGSGVYGVNPELTERLAARFEILEHEVWIEQFVRAMAGLSGWLAPLDWSEQRAPYHIHRFNLRQALFYARRLEMTNELLVLLQVSAECARNAGLLDEAAALYDEVLAGVEESDEPEAKAAACHQRGLVAQQQRKYDDAERWFQRALEIEEEIGDRHGAAMSQHQIARLEQERGRLEEAESLLLRAVTGLEEAGDAEHAAVAWRQLGRLAQERGDRARAKRLYELSLQRAADSENRAEQANTLHQLGMLAQQFRDFEEAKRCYEQALELWEGAAPDHEGPGDAAAATYHQLGTIAIEQGELDEAERLLRRSYGGERRQGNDAGAAATLAVLGLLAARQGDFPVAGRRLVRAATVFQALQQLDRLQEVVSGFARIWLRATPATQVDLRQAWEEAGLAWPDELGA